MTFLTSLKSLFYPALILACIGLYDANAALDLEGAEPQTPVHIFTGRINETMTSLEPGDEEQANCVSHVLMMKALLADFDKNFKIEEPALRDQLKSEDKAIVHGALLTLKEMLPSLPIVVVVVVEAAPLGALMRQMSVVDPVDGSSSSDEEDPYEAPYIPVVYGPVENPNADNEVNPTTTPDLPTTPTSTEKE
jgi:hypothetical protein